MILYYKSKQLAFAWNLGQAFPKSKKACLSDDLLLGLGTMTTTWHQNLVRYQVETFSCFFKRQKSDGALQNQ